MLAKTVTLPVVRRVAFNGNVTGLLTGRGVVCAAAGVWLWSLMLVSKVAGRFWVNGLRAQPITRGPAPLVYGHECSNLLF